MVPLDILLLAMEGHLPRQASSRPDRHSSAVCEPCYIFLPSITPKTYLVAVTLDSTHISLNPAPLNPPRMVIDFQLHWVLRLDFSWPNSVASIVDKQVLWCWAYASPLILANFGHGPPRCWPNEVCLDSNSNAVYSVRGSFSTYGLL